MASIVRYTEEEKLFIIENYSTMDTSEIAEKLNKTHKQIKNYANKIGLKKEKNLYFTKEDKQYIINNFPNMETEDIAKILNKDTDKIKAYAYSKRLKKNRNYIDGTNIISIIGQKFNQLTVLNLDYMRIEREKTRVKNGEIKQYSTFWACECDCGNITTVDDYSLTHNLTKSCGCTRYVNSTIASQNRFEKSFKNWCIENNEQYLLDLWDYDLNNKIPEDVAFSSSQKMYFKCPSGLHESELKKIQNLTKHDNYTYNCTKCRSFAQWGVDNVCVDFLEKYWDYDKNTYNPWEIANTSVKKVWLKCQNLDKQYHKSYETRADAFKYGNRCPYCKNQKIHRLDSLGSIYPEVIDIWSDKNDKTPYEIAPKARKKYWFKCESGIHKDYQKAIYSGAKHGFQCPECNSSKGEQRVAEFLMNNNINYTPQCEYDGLIGFNYGNLRFDFAIPSLNINIEYDGEGHYMPIDFDGEGIENAKEKFKVIKYHDKLKNEYCKNQKIKLIRIPYWNFNNIEEILRKELKLN